MSVRYRVTVAGGDDRVTVAGGDDRGSGTGEATLSIPIEIAASDGFDASVEYMRGRLKVTGATSAIFEVLASGEATAVLTRLATD